MTLRICVYFYPKPVYKPIKTVLGGEGGLGSKFEESSFDFYMDELAIHNFYSKFYFLFFQPCLKLVCGGSTKKRGGAPRFCAFSAPIILR